MNRMQASLIGGLLGGLAMSLAMSGGRRSGLLHKTLAEDSEDWLDRTAGTRRLLGDGGTTVLEQINHGAASAAFGMGYGLLAERLPDVPAVLLGGLYGAGLYGVNIAGMAPVLGITEGERAAPGSVRMERLGLHLLYGVVTAFATKWLVGSQRARAR